MRLQVVDGKERLAVHERDGFGHGRTDDDAADQARPRGRGDGGQIGIADLRLGHGAGDQPVEMLEMRAGGDFRHHPAIGAVFFQLRQHDFAAHPPRIVHHGSRRLVATRLDAENDHRLQCTTWDLKQLP